MSCLAPIKMFLNCSYGISLTNESSECRSPIVFLGSVSRTSMVSALFTHDPLLLFQVCVPPDSAVRSSPDPDQRLHRERVQRERPEICACPPSCAGPGFSVRSDRVSPAQFPGVLAYCMSKSAIDQFTRCIALGEWRPGESPSKL